MCFIFFFFDRFANKSGNEIKKYTKGSTQRPYGSIVGVMTQTRIYIYDILAINQIFVHPPRTPPPPVFLTLLGSKLEIKDLTSTRDKLQAIV